MFAGGGTGGHLMPGAATAEALQQLFPDARCLFMPTSRSSELHCHRAVQQYEVVPVPAPRWEGTAHKLRFFGAALGACERSIELICQFRPDVVVGLGGYSCAAPVAIARAMGLPTMLFESNARPGRVTRTLAPVVDCVQLQWEAAAEHLKARRVLVSGNPVRARILRGERRAARRRFRLDPEACTLLVMGGSQGALPLNRLFLRALKRLAQRPLPIPPQALQVLHLTGPDNLDEVRWTNAPPWIPYRAVGFLEEMEDAYAAADLVLARAGGSSLAEITAVGLPAVLVPYPHATDDHQSANAAVLARAGAAVTVPQAKLTPERLAGLLAQLVTDPARLRRMAAAARRLGRPDAARMVALELAAMGGQEVKRFRAPQGDQWTRTQTVPRRHSAA